MSLQHPSCATAAPTTVPLSLERIQKIEIMLVLLQHLHVMEVLFEKHPNKKILIQCSSLVYLKINGNMLVMAQCHYIVLQIEIHNFKGDSLTFFEIQDIFLIQWACGWSRS